MHESHYSLAPIGFLRSPLKERGAAPNQGREGAPDAWLVVDAAVAEGLEGIEVGAELIVITWLHQAERDILKTRSKRLMGPWSSISSPCCQHRLTFKRRQPPWPPLLGGVAMLGSRAS